MDVKKYIESGILELYVLGQLSPEEEKDVQDMQAKHIEIRREIYEISLGLEKYARLKAIKASENIAEKIFDHLPAKSATTMIKETTNPDKKSGLSWNLLTSLFSLTALLGFTMYFIQKSEDAAIIQKYEADLKACDSIKVLASDQFAVFQQITRPDNKIINLSPTPGYAGTSIYLHYNAVEKKNFLQLVNLPTITKDQVFQLWALRDGVDPMPLDIFADKNKIIRVNYIDNTTTYAITIEPKGGSKSPSLDRLIGTMGVI